MASHGDYVYFQFTSPNNRSFSFRTYNNERGQAVGFQEGIDKDNRPIYRRWQFTQDVRKISVHINKTDISKDAINAVNFLRNSPNCKGSPLGTYRDGKQEDVFFEEVNEAKAAQVGLDFETTRIKAQNAALDVKGQDFIDLCALIGVFNKEETVMRFSLVDYAKNKPQSFLDMVNDPIRQLRSVIRRAVHDNVFKQQGGRMLTWENTLIGVDEDDAVAKLKQDDKLLKAVKAQLDKLK
jgi:hypothetical protein